MALTLLIAFPNLIFFYILGFTSQFFYFDKWNTRGVEFGNESYWDVKRKFC